VAGAGVVLGEVLSTEGTKTSGVSKPADGASAARVSTVIIVAVISSSTSPAESGLNDYD
jgi:hypothetical protein